jgi:hypothetical protein
MTDLVKRVESEALARAYPDAYADGRTSAERLLREYPSFAKHALKMALLQLGLLDHPSKYAHPKNALQPQDFAKTRGFADFFIAIYEGRIKFVETKKGARR